MGALELGNIPSAEAEGSLLSAREEALALAEFLLQASPERQRRRPPDPHCPSVSWRCIGFDTLGVELPTSHVAYTGRQP